MPSLPNHPGRTSAPSLRAFVAPSARAAVLGLALALAPIASLAAAESAPAPAAKKQSAAKEAAVSPSAEGAPSGGSQLERAKASFEIFSKEWMEKMERASRETAAAAKASVRRGYAAGFTTELKPTDSASAPFVGLLRYVEEQHSCKDASLTDCQVTDSTNVTEIFRFQGGKWVY